MPGRSVQAGRPNSTGRILKTVVANQRAGVLGRPKAGLCSAIALARERGAWLTRAMTKIWGNPMQSDWTPEQSQALREYLASGMSYSEIADAINAKFKTAYSRNATIGRARRMGLGGLDRPVDFPKLQPKDQVPNLIRVRERYAAEFKRPPVFEAVSTKLRCVEIDPRHLSLIELETGDCRYPYGGDAEGEAITFCGHPQRVGSSYCVSHFHLTRGDGSASERSAVKVLLRLVAA
jgi:GcrA cell cycle regulator